MRIIKVEEESEVIHSIKVEEDSEEEFDEGSEEDGEEGSEEVSEEGSEEEGEEGSEEEGEEGSEEEGDDDEGEDEKQGDPSPYSEAKIVKWMAAFDEETRQDLLKNAALLHTAVAQSLKAKYDQTMAEEKRKITFFDKCVLDVKELLIYRGRAMLHSTQYTDEAYVAIEKIGEIAGKIAKEVNKQDTFETKFRALNAFQRIAEEVAGAVGHFGVFIKFNMDSKPGDHLINLCGKFTDHDRDRLADIETSDGSDYLTRFEYTADSFGLVRHNFEFRRATKILWGAMNDRFSDDSYSD